MRNEVWSGLVRRLACCSALDSGIIPYADRHTFGSVQLRAESDDTNLNLSSGSLK